MCSLILALMILYIVKSEKREKMNLLNKIKTSETVDRLKSEISPYFKPFQYLGAILCTVGLLLWFVKIFFKSHLPVDSIDDIKNYIEALLQVGGTMFTITTLTKKK
jgi:hypothetical protein